MVKKTKTKNRQKRKMVTSKAILESFDGGNLLDSEVITRGITKFQFPDFVYDGKKVQYKLKSCKDCL